MTSLGTDLGATAKPAVHTDTGAKKTCKHTHTRPGKNSQCYCTGPIKRDCVWRLPALQRLHDSPVRLQRRELKHTAVCVLNAERPYGRSPHHHHPSSSSSKMLNLSCNQSGTFTFSGRISPSGRHTWLLQLLLLVPTFAQK